ncbi:MAG: hypothetical protein GY847_21230 [Proteobacteria bacterium]|nr:hypothetical protein [Pseudomonadota bacterium]
MTYLAMVPLLLSCNGKAKEVVAIAGVAASAQVIQTARAQNPKNKPTTNLCCKMCGKGYFPCGDECRQNGMIPPCFKPPGCACYGWMDGMPEGLPPSLQSPVAFP